jgi:hypothetical protein
MELLAVMEKVAMNPELMETLRGLAGLPLEGRTAILELIRFSNEKNQQVKKRKPNKKKES